VTRTAPNSEIDGPPDHRGQLPAAFVDRLRAILSEPAATACLDALRHRPAPCFRVNTLRCAVEPAVSALREAGLAAQPLAWRDDAFCVPGNQRSALTHSALSQNAEIYLQNPASMLPVQLLEPQPTDWILDLAAAPGSKTHQLACAMNNEGRISAVEAVRGRFFKLKHNLERLGVANTRCYLKDGAKVWRSCPEQFDRVLLDAPCSSEGQFNCEQPDKHRFWSEKKIKEMSRKQKRLLFSAIQSLKAGGVLVYSTCSFAPEENELVIAAMLRRFAGALEVDEITLPCPNWQPGLDRWRNESLDAQLRHARRIIPDGLMEGFFVCRMRKLDSTIKERSN
jgi:16S rRNA (cytosine1407-C5)-methyltransferase